MRLFLISCMFLFVIGCAQKQMPIDVFSIQAKIENLYMTGQILCQEKLLPVEKCEQIERTYVTYKSIEQTMELLIPVVSELQSVVNR